MYRKVLAAALTATMVGSMLTVAGAEEAKKNIPTLTTDPLEIHYGIFRQKIRARTICEDAVARFTADYPNITVTMTVHQQNDNYKQQLVVAMSSEGSEYVYSLGRWPDGRVLQVWFCK